jgi:hypothetical protein
MEAVGEDASILTVDVEEDFRSIYDVPYVTVNKIDGQFVAEVIFSGNPEVDLDRVSTALRVGLEHGVRAYARVFGTYGNVLIYFTDDPLGGLIYGPSADEIGGEWLN